MRGLCRASLAFGAAAALWAPLAHAGRPLQAEDAGLLDRGACEIEGASARLDESSLSVREHTLQLGCGVGASTQLALALSRGEAAGLKARGFEINGKTRLWTGTAAANEEPAGLVIAYALGWARLDGDSSRRSATELNLAYSRPLPAALTVHANLGHARDEVGKARSTTWALALEHEGFGPVAPMAELFGDDRSAAWWNLGLRATLVPEQWFVDASYGRQMSSAAPTLWTVGFKFAF